MVSVGCVLLAAGESRRFGPEDKLLIGERPLLAQAMEKIASVGFARRLAVVSKREAADMAEQWGFEWVWNSGPARGIYSSIALGAENMTGPCMFSVADQPRMTEVILRDMAEAYENGTILQIRCQGQVGNPVIFPENLLRELAALGPGESGRTVIWFENC